MEGKVLDKRNSEKKVLFLGRKNIHSRLIQRELCKCNKFSIKHQDIERFSQDESVDEIAVVLIGYDYINDQLYNHLLSAMTLNLNLVIYNVPLDLCTEEIAPWVCLKGILYEDAPVEHLIRCVESVANGNLWLPRELMPSMLNQLKPYALSSQHGLEELTKREKQILDRLVCGRSNLQIANELFVAESTVKTHIYKLYKKINVNCRREAIRFVRQHGDVEVQL